jgi:HlyD family secretion protein
MNIQNLPNPEEIEAVLGIDETGARRKWLRRGIWAVMIASLAAVALWFGPSFRSSAVPYVYDTSPATIADLVITVTATGKIQPTEQVDVSSEMSGIVKSVAVESNSVVKKGDTLAELDLDRALAQRDRAAASLESAEARLADAKATVVERNLALARQETLQKKGLSARQELDAARAAQTRAEAAVLQAEAEIAVAKANLLLRQTDIDKSRIVSPIDGIVLKRAVEPGQTVASSLQAPVLFTLAGDLRQMQVEVDVDEADIGAVKPEQDATFTVDAYVGRRFPARIETVEFAPLVTEGVVTYKAVLTVDNSDLSLRPGMTATSEIVVQNIPSALTVPNAALRYSPPRETANTGFNLMRLFVPRMPRAERPVRGKAEKGQATVHVMRNGVPEPISITVGATDGAVTEVLSGDLKDGDQLILNARRSGT